MKRYGFEQHTQVYNVSYSVKMNTKKVPKGRGGGGGGVDPTGHSGTQGSTMKRGIIMKRSET